MHAHRSSLIFVFGMVVVALAVATPFRAGAGPTPTVVGDPFTPPPAPADMVVLYDQYNSPGEPPNAVASQNFEALYDIYDCEVGDDFVIPGSDSWRIELVEVDGNYSPGGGPARSVNVSFYTNDNVSGLPGNPICTFADLAFVDVAGDFTIPVPNPCCLTAGTYWLVVQVNMDFDPTGQWFWEDRVVQSNEGAAWRNPGDGFGFSCPTWSRKTTCVDAYPDNFFRLSGTRPCAATPVETTTWGAIKAIYP